MTMNGPEPDRPGTDERDLQSLLRAVAEDDATLGASPSIEKHLLGEVQAIARMRRTRMRMLPFAAAAAVLLAIALPAWYASRHQTNVAEHHPISDADAASVREEATEFFPLPYSEVPAQGGYMVRMQVPRTALRSFGVQGFGNPDATSATVTADVLVGGDGLARAVRFVRVIRNQERQEQP
ncbi:MAG TPA: hypothetical protein VGF24_08955 [Vicinamibacterales bacterium]|jgi:hypothetical protein